jgi:hypothetical protein
LRGGEEATPTPQMGRVCVSGMGDARLESGRNVGRYLACEERSFRRGRRRGPLLVRAGLGLDEACFQVATVAIYGREFVRPFHHPQY